MTDPATQPSTLRRLGLSVRGVVQGVGFRPFVYNTARACGLAGWVRNETERVRIEVQGDPAALDAFLHALEHEAPPQARIDSIDVERIDPVEGTTSETPFEIRPSRELASRRPATAADLATCEACLVEIRDPLERRFGYPFTNCTNCGPRWSIIEGLPYDRPRTSMSRFAMCEACRAEYDSPADRRFHAQPIACPDCGPELRLLDPGGNVLGRRGDALRAAVEAIADGKIVAMKGLGGFQLLVDATTEESIQRLRRRKHRPAKPFAVMIGSLDEARRHCTVSDEEAALLTSPAAPIVLLRRNRPGGMPTPAWACDAIPERSEHAHASVGMLPSAEKAIVEAVAPGNPDLGVMLPYTPLHHLLMDAIARPIVCTSGNLSEEPMAITTAEAIKRLGRIADLVLTHNRRIVRPVDDSVVRCDSTGPVVLRRARGYAPLPIKLSIPGPPLSRRAGSPATRQSTPGTRQCTAGQASSGTLDALPIGLDHDGPTVLAVGGHLKNAVALRLGRQVVVGSHVGDLDSPQSLDVHRRAIDDLLSFFDVRPEVIACDLHPDYLSTQHAERLATEWRVPLARLQHHHAHVAACVAEHRLAGPVLGFAWDGLGYGPDRTVWGGEALRCERATFERVAHLRYFSLPGGERAIRRPRRLALGVLFEIAPELAGQQAAEWFTPAEQKTLLTMLRRGTHCPRTSSVGRLFDAVAALCGLPEDTLLGKPAVAPGTGDVAVSFEGQAAMALEFAAEEDCDEAYPIRLAEGEPIVADWEALLRAVLADRAAGVSTGRISARFHNALAAWALEIARRADCPQVVLSGGCFQNRLLSERVRRRLSQSGFSVYTHQQVPPGDGGIALGQAYLAAIPHRS